MRERGASTGLHVLSVTVENADEWLSLFAGRNEVADQYALLLRHNGPDWGGWRQINQAIVRRWSPAALKYVKTRAWKNA